jgi:hypothetical protein
MATPAPITPAAVLAQNRHQGGLREYVNQRLAPYIKKALKDVCDVECATSPSPPLTSPLTSPKRAEYPLQWLGEHLINQSFLYENNPDATGIKERFFYNFDEPPQQDQNDARTPSAPPGEAPAEHDTANTSTDTNAQLPSFSDTTAGEETRQLYNGDQAISTHMGGTDESYTGGEEIDMGQEQSNGDTNGEMLNGVTDAVQEDSSTAQVNDDGGHVVDTEMAGTA